MKVVCVSGWGMPTAVWQPMISALRAQGVRWDIVCHPAPGCEQDSVLLDQSLAVADMWVGWSLGSQHMLSALFRQVARPRVGAVFLASTPCFVARDGWCGMDVETFNTFCDGVLSSPDTTLRRFKSLLAEGCPDRRQVLAMLRAWSIPDVSTLCYGLQLLREHDFRAGLGQITLPVIWVHGEQDVVINCEVACQSAARMAGGRMELLAGQGHALPVSAAWLCAKQVMQMGNMHESS